MVAVVLVLPLPASAQIPDPDGPTWELEPELDISAMIAPGLMSVGWLLSDELGPAWCAPECDPSDVNFFDRWAAGNWDPTWALISDFALYGALAMNLGVLWAEEGTLNALNDVVVIGQSMLFTNMTAIVADLASRRPRPYLYSDAAPLEERNRGIAALSFFSGHVGAAMAVTTANFQTLHRRDGDSAVPWVVLAGGSALTLLAGIGRVLSGNHFPSDVLIGIAMGVAMGLVFPALHEPPEAEPAAAGGASGMLGFGASF